MRNLAIILAGAAVVYIAFGNIPGGIVLAGLAAAIMIYSSE